MKSDMRRILLVEDNVDHAEFIRHALAGDDVDIDHRTDGESALAYLSNGNPRPAFVLLDYKLPGKNGLEVLAALRADEKWKDLPVVMLSTFIDPQDIRKAYGLGANSFVVKPTDFESFVKKIKQIKEFWLYISEDPFRQNGNG